MRCQFSGPFNPLPPETTISASAIVTLFDVFSTEDTLFLLSEMLKLKSEISVSVGFSFRPKEFFETAKILLFLVISTVSKALFVNVFLTTTKLLSLTGIEIILVT